MWKERMRPLALLFLGITAMMTASTNICRFLIGVLDLELYNFMHVCHDRMIAKATEVKAGNLEMVSELLLKFIYKFIKFH